MSGVMDTMPPEALLAGYDDHIVAIAEALRVVVRRTLLDALERVRPGWRVIGYDVPVRRRTAFCCFVWPEPVHVHLGFEHGVVMSDPDGVLEGEGVTKQVRWLTFTDLEGTDTPTVRELIRESARVATLSRDQRLALLLDRDPVARP
jgi:Domain of unknown function (DU1801)